MPVLEVKNLVVAYDQGAGKTRAVDDVSFSIEPGECLALVGESGCGKTSTAKAILGLIPFESGEILVNGRARRGVEIGQAKTIGMVWQDPYASLDPRWTIGRSIAEPGLVVGQPVNIEETMREVGLDPSLASRFPHQLSGGQRQRVAIGRAIGVRPPLILCDEPTAALDLSVQAQILNLLKDLQQQRGCAYLYISHDLITVRYLADRVAVMQRGEIVEMGKTEDLFRAPQHPYTQQLLASAPKVELG